jgi:TatD DNase family protein
VLLHWLGSEETLPTAIERGYYVSFGPALLYSRKLQRMARKADRSLVVLESDSPVAYRPLGGARGPSLIPSVAFRLSELWNVSFSRTLQTCTENSMKFLSRKVKPLPSRP